VGIPRIYIYCDITVTCEYHISNTSISLAIQIIILVISLYVFGGNLMLLICKKVIMNDRPTQLMTTWKRALKKAIMNVSGLDKRTVSILQQPMLMITNITQTFMPTCRCMNRHKHHINAGPTRKSCRTWGIFCQPGVQEALIICLKRAIQDMLLM